MVLDRNRTERGLAVAGEERSAVRSQIQEMRKALHALQGKPEDEQAAQAFMAATRAVLVHFKQKNVFAPDLPAADAAFTDICVGLPDDVVRRNWYGFGDLFIRRMILEFRKTRDLSWRQRIEDHLVGARDKDSKKIDVEMLSVEKAINPKTECMFLAACAEIDIAAFQREPKPELRAAILRAVQDDGVQKYISNTYLWHFLVLEYSRRVDEAVFAGNRRDQVSNLRVLTRFMIKVRKVKPPNEKRLVKIMIRALTRAMLHADRPVAVGILEFLRDTQQLCSRDLLRLLEDDDERLDFINFYYWATGRSRDADWYLKKFQKYVRRPLKFVGDREGFAFTAAGAPAD